MRGRDTAIYFEVSPQQVLLTLLLALVLVQMWAGVTAIATFDRCRVLFPLRVVSNGVPYESQIVFLDFNWLSLSPVDWRCLSLVALMLCFSWGLGEGDCTKVPVESRVRKEKQVLGACWATAKRGCVVAVTPSWILACLVL